MEPEAATRSTASEPATPEPVAGTLVAERDYKAAVYGSLLVTTLLSVELRAIGDARMIAFTLLLSVAVFWLTHTWSALVDVRIRGPVGRAEVVRVAGDEAPMLAPAIVPTLLLALVRLAGGDIDTAITVGLVASLVQLFLWGLAVGRAAHGSWLASIAIASVDLAFGLLLVGLKMAVLH